MTFDPFVTLSAGIAFTLLGLAQGTVPLVLEDDPLPGLANVRRIRGVALAPGGAGGNWLVRVQTFDPDLARDEVLVRGGVPWRIESDPVTALPNASYSDVLDWRLCDAGALIVQKLSGTANGDADDEGVFLDEMLVLQKGDAALAAGFLPGSLFSQFSQATPAIGSRVLLRGRVVEGLYRSFLLRIDLDPAGVISSQTLIMKDGGSLSAQPYAVRAIGTGRHGAAINALGQVLWTGELETDSAKNSFLALDGTLLVLEGTPGPVPGYRWGSLTSIPVALNDAGDWAVSTWAVSPSSTTQVIARNGGKFVQTGDSLEAIAPYTLTFFAAGPVFVNDAGQVLWYGKWNNPDPAHDEGLFLDDLLIVHEGFTRAGGQVIAQISAPSPVHWELSEDGAALIFKGCLADGRQGAFLTPIELGTRYCVTSANSAGPGARIVAQGSTSVSAKQLHLRASALPPSVIGLFYHGTLATLVPFGDGFRCVAGVTLRLPASAADAAGLLQHRFDFSASAITSGSTWRFQAWYRDPAGITGFNLSDALAIVFEL